MTDPRARPQHGRVGHPHEGPHRRDHLIGADGEPRRRRHPQRADGLRPDDFDGVTDRPGSRPATRSTTPSWSLSSAGSPSSRTSATAWLTRSPGTPRTRSWLSRRSTPPKDTEPLDCVTRRGRAFAPESRPHGHLQRMAEGGPGLTNRWIPCSPRWRGGLRPSCPTTRRATERARTWRRVPPPTRITVLPQRDGGTPGVTGNFLQSLSDGSYVAFTRPGRRGTRTS